MLLLLWGQIPFNHISFPFLLPVHFLNQLLTTLKPLSLSAPTMWGVSVVWLFFSPCHSSCNTNTMEWNYSQNYHECLFHDKQVQQEINKFVQQFACGSGWSQMRAEQFEHARKNIFTNAHEAAWKSIIILCAFVRRFTNLVAQLHRTDFCFQRASCALMLSFETVFMLLRATQIHKCMVHLCITGKLGILDLGQSKTEDSCSENTS